MWRRRRDSDDSGGDGRGENTTINAGGGWTRARQRVVMNNKSVWPMMRAVTKRAARERATAYPSNIELGIDCQIKKMTIN